MSEKHRGWVRFKRKSGSILLDIPQLKTGTDDIPVKALSLREITA